VPFVSKATGVPLAKVAAKLMVGKKLSEFGLPGELKVKQYCVKSPVFPFARFAGVDTILGPEMKSTGEVMGVGQTFAEAFVKSQLAAGVRLPKGGKAFLSVRNADKDRAVDVARALTDLGFSLVATRGTAAALEKAGIKVQPVNKVQEGRPHIVDMLKNREVSLIINTVEEDRRSIQDSWSIRNTALQNKITYYTTIAGARAACMGMRHLEEMRAYDIQSLHASLPK
jgi:carbamoyl-phosphate synthase large subunit